MTNMFSIWRIFFIDDVLALWTTLYYKRNKIIPSLKDKEFIFNYSIDRKTAKERLRWI